MDEMSVNGSVRAEDRARASTVRFALTIFLSAFLLFQVQPLIGKYILPWYGGGPAVWTACMLFFQAVLLIGYSYAHWLSTRVPLWGQSRLHLALLAAALFFLPIAPEAGAWKPSPEDRPTIHILLLLVANVGVPYFLLSSTAPLIQIWFARANPGRSPYRLYALSNSGSLLALLSYPFIVEPAMTLGTQVWVWSGAFVIFAILCGWCALRVNEEGRSARSAAAGQAASSIAARSSHVPAAADDASAPSARVILLWLGLAAAASAMLLATTNQMCQEVTVVPFLWVLPLALYLLSFIICFEHDRWYDRRWFGLLLAVMTPLACFMLYAGVMLDIRLQILTYSATLFACCMTCHGELVRLKPNPRRLTLFYLIISAGGALGGLFVAVGAQRFAGYWEFHIALAACVLLTMLGWYVSRSWKRHFREPAWAWAGMTLVMLFLVSVLGAHAYWSGKGALVTSRNFYGVLRVTEEPDGPGVKRMLSHGRIVHGLQFTDEARRWWPTAYYGRQSGVGLALEHYPRRGASGNGEQGLRVGVVGLGVGTLAAFGQPGDTFRFYEINPEVVRYSRQYFTYTRDTPATIEAVLGDARVQLERELAEHGSQQFDILAVDAFSSDAIPVHLITTQAVELYRKHLKDDGLLLFHITNRSVDLTPVARGLARLFGWRAARIESPRDDLRGLSQSLWVILTKNEKFLAAKEIRDAITPWSESDPQPLIWTDDFASLWQVLK